MLSESQTEGAITKGYCMHFTVNLRSVDAKLMLENRNVLNTGDFSAKTYTEITLNSIATGHPSDPCSHQFRLLLTLVHRRF